MSSANINNLPNKIYLLFNCFECTSSSVTLLLHQNFPKISWNCLEGTYHTFMYIACMVCSVDTLLVFKIIGSFFSRLYFIFYVHCVIIHHSDRLILPISLVACNHFQSIYKYGISRRRIIGHSPGNLF